MREWIEEGRFVASLSGFALTGDTLHHRASTWSVLGMRAEVVEGSVGQVMPADASGDDAPAPEVAPPPDDALTSPPQVVVEITTADGGRIVIAAPAKKLRQAHDLALKVNQASAYFASRQQTPQDPARIV